MAAARSFFITDLVSGSAAGAGTAAAALALVATARRAAGLQGVADRSTSGEAAVSMASIQGEVELGNETASGPGASRFIRRREPGA